MANVRRAVLAVIGLSLAVVASAVLPGASPGVRPAFAPVAFRESVAAPTARPLKLRLPTAGTSGGVYTAPSGDTVRVFAATPYVTADPSFNQRWADFLASASHGSELSQLTLVFQPLSTVQSLCGDDALACYSNDTIVAPGDDPAEALPVASVLLHEYGHHIADHRDNAPWAAVDYGTKRWASDENICRRTRAGELHPGDEDANYQLNPGEAWAETYRVIAEQALGMPSPPWLIVRSSFYPDAAALAAARADVLDPWTGNSTTTVKGSLRRAQKQRRVRIATPYDGTFTVGVTNRTNTPLTLRLVDTTGTALATTKVAKARAATLRSSICGQRTVQLELSRTAGGTGSFVATISKP